MKIIFALYIAITSVAVAQFPDFLPVGNRRIAVALEAARSVTITSADSDAGFVRNSHPRKLECLETMEDLVYEVEEIHIKYSVNDASKRVRLEAEVVDSCGIPLFYGAKSFRLQKKNEKWVFPTYVCKFKFKLAAYWIKVLDVAYAQAVNEYSGDVVLLSRGDDGEIIIPDEISSDFTWNFRLTFTDDSTYLYDGLSGVRMPHPY